MEIRKAKIEEFLGIVNHPEIKSSVMIFSKRAQCLGLFIDGQCVACVCWIEYSCCIKLKSGFVLPEHRKKGYYRQLCEARMKILGRVKPLYANCTVHALPYHLKQVAKIIKVYKAPSYKIKYDAQK